MKGTGFDILVDKELNDIIFITILSNIFNLNKTYIYIAHSIEELAEPLEVWKDNKILVIMHKVYGEFCNLAQFSISCDIQYNIEDVVIKISKYGDTKCLLPDETKEYSDVDMILFYPNGTKTTVEINSDSLNRNEYIIERYTEVREK